MCVDACSPVQLQQRFVRFVHGSECFCATPEYATILVDAQYGSMQRTAAAMTTMAERHKHRARRRSKTSRQHSSPSRPRNTRAQSVRAPLAAAHHCEAKLASCSSRLAYSAVRANITRSM